MAAFELRATLGCFALLVAALKWDMCAASDLGAACREGDVRLAQHLLSNSADIDASLGGGHRALHEAALEGHAPVLSLLLQHGADIRATDDHKQTSLHWAATGGHAAVVRLLLTKGASARAADSEGRTPLHSAAGGGHMTVIKQLLQHNAVVDGLDDHGTRPSWWAREQGHGEAAAYLDAAAPMPLKPEESEAQKVASGSAPRRLSGTMGSAQAMGYGSMQQPRVLGDLGRPVDPPGNPGDLPWRSSMIPEIHESGMRTDL